MEGLEAGVWDEQRAGLLKAIAQPVVVAEYLYLAVSRQDGTFTREEAKAAFGPYPPGTLRFEALEVEQRPAPFVQFEALPSGELVWLSPAVEWDVTFHMRYKPTGHLRLWYGKLPDGSGPPAVDTVSGLYQVVSGGIYHDATDTPDNYSLANTRPFADLFKVTA